MSAPDTVKTDYVDWLQALPIPWLVAGPIGALDVASYGYILDFQIALLREAVKARYPDYAPSDALPHIGGDRGLLQGSESNSTFGTRLKYAWETWGRAGQPVTLLEQLYWAGFTSAVLVQQNGISYTLSGAPTAGADPTSLLTTQFLNQNPYLPSNPAVPVVLTIVHGGVLGTMQYTVAVNGGAAGSTLGSSGSFATFYAWLGSTYTLAAMEAGTYVLNSTYTFNTDGTITLGGGAIDTVTQQSTPWWTIDTDDDFCSRFMVLLPSGFATLTTQQLSTIRTIINQWRPGNMTCAGVSCLASGRFWGWPSTEWGIGGLVWGGSSTAYTTPATGS